MILNISYVQDTANTVSDHLKQAPMQNTCLFLIVNLPNKICYIYFYSFEIFCDKILLGI